MRVFFLIAFLFPQFAFCQGKTIRRADSLFAIKQSAPPQLWSIFKDSGLNTQYKVNFTHLNPFYYHGDFDGDNNTDYAVLLKENNGESNRLTILCGNKDVHFLDPDKKLRYPPLTAWYVYSKNWNVDGSPYEAKKAPELIGDALMIIQVEASSSLIYWNGKRFESYWMSD